MHLETKPLNHNLQVSHFNKVSLDYKEVSESLEERLNVRSSQRNNNSLKNEMLKSVETINVACRRVDPFNTNEMSLK
jgi:hypothetical protein